MNSQVLTALERTVVLYLHDHRDRSVSRDELLREVWKADPSTASRTVDVTIGRIRKKLASGALQGAELRTVRGAGYRYAGAELRQQLRPPASAFPFVGRDALLEQMATWLATRRGVLTVVGTVGIGKSALVRHFAMQHPSVQYVDLDVRPPPSCLEPGRAVVFDNADPYASTLRELVTALPTQACRVVVACRRPLGLARERVVMVPPMTSEESSLLLRSVVRIRTGDERVPSAPHAALYGMPWLIVAAGCSGEWSDQARLDDALPRHRTAQAVAETVVHGLSADEQRVVQCVVSGLGWVGRTDAASLLGETTTLASRLDALVRVGVLQESADEVRALPYLEHALPVDVAWRRAWSGVLVAFVRGSGLRIQWALATRMGPTFLAHLATETDADRIVRLTQAVVRIANFTKAPSPEQAQLPDAVAQSADPAALQALAFDRALLADRDGEHAAALATMRDCVQWFRTHQCIDELVWSVTWLGLIERDHGDPQRALQHIREAYEVALAHDLSGPAASALLTLGAMRIDVGEYAQALGCCHGARALAPDDPTIATLAASNLGTALVLLGRGRDALKEYESMLPPHGLPEEPTDPVECLLLGNMAEALVMDGKARRASAFAKRAVRGLQKSSSSLTDHFRVVWAQAELMRDRPDEALSILHHADPTNDRWAERIRRWIQVALRFMNSPTTVDDPIANMPGWVSVQRYDELVYERLIRRRQG